MSTKKPSAGKRPPFKFRQPLFTRAVSERLHQLARLMPLPVRCPEFILWIHELTRQWLHPVLFNLADEMNKALAMATTSEWKLMPLYPTCTEDQRRLWEWDAARKKDSSTQLEDAQGMPGRAWSRLISDIAELMRLAAVSADTTLFMEWGRTCEAVAMHMHEGRSVSLSIEVKDGVLKTDPVTMGDVQDFQPSFTMEICEARMTLKVHWMEKGSKRTIPDDPKVARLIWEKRKQRAGGEAPATTVDAIRRKLAIYCKRLGLPRHTLSAKRK